METRTAVEIAGGLFLALVILRPVHVLLHELGHAGAVLLLTNAIPTVCLGGGRIRRGPGIGRLHLRIGLAGWARGTCGYESVGVTRARRIAIAGAGPLASLLAGSLCLIAAGIDGPGWLRALLLGSALAHGGMFLASAWPGRGHPPSDGAQIRELLDRVAA